jgi:3-deoxy-D-manno-octulosonic-acid transferase
MVRPHASLCALRGAKTLSFNKFIMNWFINAIYVFFYSFGVRAYGAGLWLAAFFSPKARQWRDGRQNWRQRLKTDLAKLNPDNRPVFWLHCASLGEYEQGRSLVELLQQNEAQNYFIALSFFSPSGYEVCKNKAAADWVGYLPLDTAANARDFIDILQPAITVFVRYEFWYHYLSQLKKQNRKLYLISAVFSQNSLVFRPILGRLHRQMLYFYSYIFVQDTASADLLKPLFSVKEENLIFVCGDTRIDAILTSKAKAENAAKNSSKNSSNSMPAALSGWSEGAPVFILASVYVQELPFLLHLSRLLIANNWRVLLVPHNVDTNTISQFQAAFARENLPLDFALWSQLETKNNIDNQLVIIDKIGLLKRLYALSEAAYIGGALTGGNVHNIAEAACYGIATFFGKSRRRFVEAQALTAANLAFLLPQSKTEAQKMAAAETLFAQLIASQKETEKARIKVGLVDFFAAHAGATAKILDKIRG